MNRDEGQIKAKREAAARARRLAPELTQLEDRDRVLAFAADLEAQADALELAPPPAKQVTQMQMQVQQGPPQVQQGLPKNDNDKSES